MTDDELYEALTRYISPHKRELFDRLAPLRTRHLTVVLEDIYQPHNASAVVRTCDLVGVQDMHVIENRNAYTLNPEVSLGASKWVDIHRYRKDADNTTSCIEGLRARGYRIIVTSPHGTSDTPSTLDLSSPVAICFGTELTGASDTLMRLADGTLRIPMYGFTESFNISVSAALVLYTLSERMRMLDPHAHCLDADAVRALKLAWARKQLRDAPLIEERLRAGTLDG
ncbi:MAG: RNA methyltransferase [Flavobacteriales bacterium]|nr:RNA methyltransferase [Flavobacteriales bacterium]